MPGEIIRIGGPEIDSERYIYIRDRQAERARLHTVDGKLYLRRGLLVLGPHVDDDIALRRSRQHLVSCVGQSLASESAPILQLE